MPDFLVSVVIPTLAADARLRECLESLKRQTRRDFEVIIVDNSGEGLVHRNGVAMGVRVIENSTNAGFGAAINQGLRASTSPYIATLNDVAPADEAVMGKLFTTAAAIARQRGIAERGWRAVVNVNRDAHQLVFHVHLHLLAGRRSRIVAILMRSLPSCRPR